MQLVEFLWNIVLPMDGVVMLLIRADKGPQPIYARVILALLVTGAVARMASPNERNLAAWNILVSLGLALFCQMHMLEKWRKPKTQTQLPARPRS